jgi:kynureninase
VNDDTLLHYRSEFPILEKKNYLISNSLGAMPVSVYNRMNDYAVTWATMGVSAWEHEWWELALKTGNAIAPVIGANEDEISMHPNITTIQSIILSCFDDDKKRNGRTKIVSEELNFPSLIYVTRAWTESRGCRLELVPSDDGIGIDTQKMIDAIDENTFLVTMSHILFKSAYVQDAQSIIEKAHSVGAYVMLDAYQSVGIYPVDVKHLDVDFLAAGVLKWLCGGPGGCFLYVHPELRSRLEPGFTGWFAHRRPFDFDTEKIDYREDSYRFLNGTPAIPALYASCEGIKIIQQAGIHRIRNKSTVQTELIIERAREYGFRVNSPLDAECRGGTVTLDVPHGYGVSRELIDRDIIVDYRKGAGIRIAPHFYNTDEEAVHAVDAIHDILESGSYKKHGDFRSVVT